MNDPLLHLGRLEERAAGVYQYSLSYAGETLTRSGFESQGLRLPNSLEKAILKRQLDYLAGRYCVLKIYQALGLTDLAVPEIGEDRAPLWPSAWVGSVSHTKDWACAILAPSPPYSLLGCDMEYLIEGRSPGLFQQICQEEEEYRALSQALGTTPEQALTLIFSAKESLFKALYPQVRKFFGFHAAWVTPLDSTHLRIEIREDLVPFVAGQQWTLSFRSLADRLWETLLIA